MIKHNRRLSVLLSMGVLLMLLLTGCDSSGSSSSYKAVDSVADNSVNTNQSDSTGAAYESSESGSNLAEGSSETLKDRKIIQKYNYCVETKNFDELINKLTEQVNKLNGYVESSSLYSSGYNSSLGTRTVNYVIRIPKESTESMTEFIASNSVVTSKEMTTEDVTLKYVDVESRLKALKTEKASLESMLSDATNVTDTIAIRDRLTTVIYEIESYTSQLKTYDNLVDYITINIDVQEVERTTVVEDQTMLQEIGNKFKNNVSDIGSGLRVLVIWLVSSMPYFVLYGILLFSFTVFIRAVIKGRKKDTDKHFNKK